MKHAETICAEMLKLIEKGENIKRHRYDRINGHEYDDVSPHGRWMDANEVRNLFDEMRFTIADFISKQ